MPKLPWHNKEEIIQRLKNENVEMDFIRCILNIHSVPYLLRETRNISFNIVVGNEGTLASLKSSGGSFSVG